MNTVLITGADRAGRIRRGMAIHTLFNRLVEEGFTFRVLVLDDFSAGEASYALTYFLQDRSLDDSVLHADEKRLVMRDKYEREIPW